LLVNKYGAYGATLDPACLARSRTGPDRPHHTGRTIPAPTIPAPTIPQRLAALLHVVRVLLGHGRRLVEIVPQSAAKLEFATLAAVFGTYTMPAILARLQRGLLRAMALERYLLARAAKGREIGFVYYRDPRERAPAKPPAEPATKGAQDGESASEVADGRAKPGDDERAPKRPAFDPDDLRIPGPEELDAEVRRRSFGRTILSICMDLAVIPGFCTGPFWNQISDTLMNYGGSFTTLFKIREHRETSFQKERDKKPDTWDFTWRHPPPETVRQVLGYMVGEAPILDPPGPRLATAPP